MDKARRHLGRPAKIKIEEDEFELKPLGFEDIPDLMYIMSRMAGTEGQPAFEKLDKETIIILRDLIKKTIDISYPDWDEKLRKDFITANFTMLMGKLFEINDFGTGRDVAVRKRIDHIKKIRARVDADKKIPGESEKKG